MREFIVVGHRAVTDGQFSLNDLPGSAGRMDIMCRCVNSALFLSHDLRRDTVIYLVLLGVPGPSKIVKISGRDVRYLNPDERSSGSLIKKALELKSAIRWKESTPGVWVRQGGLEDLLAELNFDTGIDDGNGNSSDNDAGGSVNKDAGREIDDDTRGRENEDGGASAVEDIGCKLYYLHEDGIDIRDEMKGPLPKRAIFILGDHEGMTTDEEQKIIDAGASSLNVGPLSLHADHCIIVVNNELDRKK
ncbi:MAG: tRNA (pseudouridine(54)-N(1))-methyltransferase TrmY [Methanosarcinales archaeon]|nr:tRNA (pseudouridine(54)-N(1))-methyltransferase TrmY [Methanosarcinales archaeon]